jgi:Rrf2 family cysteine metabolism transcriptional repressor
MGMRISTRGRYALRMMQDIARNGIEGRPVSLASVAARTDISLGYLEQLAIALKHGQLVRGVAGRYGGYVLTREPSEISLRDIVETAIGPICVVDCVEDPAGCPRAEDCECRMVYGLVNQRLAEVLEEFSLDDLVHPGRVMSFVDVESLSSKKVSNSPVG